MSKRKLSELEQSILAVSSQWEECSLLKVFEFEIKNQEGCEDYLVVNLEIETIENVTGITFSFDCELEQSFSGEVEKVTDIKYMLPINEYEDCLDIYLEQIYTEIMEGYILPNGLYPDTEF